MSNNHLKSNEQNAGGRYDLPETISVYGTRNETPLKMHFEKRDYSTCNDTHSYQTSLSPSSDAARACRKREPRNRRQCSGR